MLQGPCDSVPPCILGLDRVLMLCCTPIHTHHVETRRLPPSLPACRQSMPPCGFALGLFLCNVKTAATSDILACSFTPRSCSFIHILL